MKRRAFLQSGVSIAAALAGAGSVGLLSGCARDGNPALSMPGFRRKYEISLAQWSLHKTLFAGDMDPLDFPAATRREFDLDAVELVNQFYKEKVRDTAYWAEFKQRADGEGMRCLLIMCDGEGALGDPDPNQRRQAAENHHKWADLAKSLGCHSIRVNADTRGVGGWDHQLQRAADGLRQLSTYCAPLGLNCIVENHGGLSSHGLWLSGVMREVNMPNCGTLPDFGNFSLGNDTWYDRYQGVAELMPFAKAVSAKAHDFDEQGNCTDTDYNRMMKIVLDAGYRGYVGIEYEGSRLSEVDGIRATQRLLERVRDELA